MTSRIYNRCPSIVFYRKSFNPEIFYKRSHFVPSHLIGSRISVHVGNKFKSILIRPLIIGYRFGDFSFTKIRGFEIHKRKRKKKLNF